MTRICRLLPPWSHARDDSYNWFAKLCMRYVDGRNVGAFFGDGNSSKRAAAAEGCPCRMGAAGPWRGKVVA